MYKYHLYTLYILFLIFIIYDYKCHAQYVYLHLMDHAMYNYNIISSTKVRNGNIYTYDSDVLTYKKNLKYDNYHNYYHKKYYEPVFFNKYIGYGFLIDVKNNTNTVYGHSKIYDNTQINIPLNINQVKKYFGATLFEKPVVLQGNSFFPCDEPDILYTEKINKLCISDNLKKEIYDKFYKKIYEHDQNINVNNIICNITMHDMFYNKIKTYYDSKNEYIPWYEWKNNNILGFDTLITEYFVTNKFEIFDFNKYKKYYFNESKYEIINRPILSYFF